MARRAPERHEESSWRGLGVRAAREPGVTRNRARFVAGLAAFIAILAVAAYLRFVDLASNPGGLYPDEAAEGLDALRMLHQPGFHPDWLVWFTDDGGREALFAYIVAGMFGIFGGSVLVLRETAAAIGVAGVLGIGWLARRWGPIVSISAAGWAAGSLWLVAVSRDGMRNTMVPLFGSVALIALLRWSDRPGRRGAAIAGATVAIASLYTYQPLKLLPVLAALWLVCLRHIDRSRFEAMKPGFVSAIATFLVVGAPMLAVAATEPASYFGRIAAVSPIDPYVQSGGSLPDHIVRTIGMFGFFGDPNARQDVSSLPLVSIPIALIAAIGVGRLWRLRGQPAESLILLALPVFMLPPLIAVEGGSPHFLRSLGLAVPLAVTIGIGVREIVGWGAGWRPSFGRVLGVAAAGLLVATAIVTGVAYLDRPVRDRWDGFSYPIVALADAARSHPGAAVIVDDYSAMDVEFLDFDSPPAIFTPGARIEAPQRYAAVLAASRSDLAGALGSAAAADARPIAWDPWGNATVWEAAP